MLQSLIRKQRDQIVDNGDRGLSLRAPLLPSAYAREVDALGFQIPQHGRCQIPRLLFGNQGKQPPCRCGDDVHSRLQPKFPVQGRVLILLHLNRILRGKMPAHAPRAECIKEQRRG